MRALTWDDQGRLPKEEAWGGREVEEAALEEWEWGGGTLLVSQQCTCAGINGYTHCIKLSDAEKDLVRVSICAFHG